MWVRHMKQTYFVELCPSSTCDQHTKFRKLRLLPTSGMEKRSPPETSCFNYKSATNKVRRGEGASQLNQPS